MIVKTYNSREKIDLKKIKNNSNKSVDISIIIRCKNEEEKIDECLKKIELQETRFTYEVIIIDSGSFDKTINIAKKHNVNIYSIPSEQFCFGSSVQLGANLSNGKYCVFLSAHCIPYNEKWLDNLINEFDDDTAAVYGKQTFYKDTIFLEKESLINTFGNHKKIQKWSNNYMKFVDYRDDIVFSNANACIKKEIINKIPFRNIIASEDREWALRTIKEGYTIKYTPKAIVYHAHNEKPDKYYKRIFINSKALYEFTGVHINLLQVVPLYLFCLLKDLVFIIKNKESFLDCLLISAKYRWLYVKAHYLATRERGR